MMNIMGIIISCAKLPLKRATHIIDIQKPQFTKLKLKRTFSL